jgi:hypothetical protein
MSATLGLTCDRGALQAKIVLAPTMPATLQTLEFTRIARNRQPPAVPATACAILLAWR